MRKTLTLAVFALAFALPASAQSRLSGKVHCAKADPDYTIAVGDAEGHLLTARKAACTWSGGMQIAGMDVKTGTDVATGEVQGMNAKDNGYHTAVMDNGDRFTVHFMGAATMAKDMSGTITGKWTFVSGTGKLKGIKGGGTYKGTANTDGSGDVMVEGTYTLPTTTTSPAKK